MAIPEINPMAPAYLPPYIAAADGSDFLFNFMAIFTLGVILLIGVLYLTLHAMPERMAHESNHSQLQVVGILALLALFTHNNLFWVVAILVAAFRMPDFMTPLNSIASSLAVATRGGRVDAQFTPNPEPTGDEASADAPKRDGEV